MPRLGILNMTIGFCLIFVAASAGAFIAVDTTYRFLEGATQPTWRSILEASSHGHTSMFGMIHILFGLTLSYSVLSNRLKMIQTTGIFCGAFAMGPGMMMRAAFGPTSSFEWNGLVIGGLLSAALGAIGIHIYGLVAKLMQRT